MDFADSVLQEAPVLVLDRLVCNIPSICNGALDDTMFCAGDLVNKRGSCFGDSGGSLVCPIEGIVEVAIKRKVKLSWNVVDFCSKYEILWVSVVNMTDLKISGDLLAFTNDSAWVKKRNGERADFFPLNFS